MNRQALSGAIESANTGLDAIKRAPIVDHNTGIKCLRIQDVSQKKQFAEWGFTEVRSDNYERFKLLENDILIARTGASIGVNRFIHESVASVFNNGLIRIRIEKKSYFPKFVYYLIQSDNFKEHINAIAFSTSAQPNMKIRDFLRFEFVDLPLPEQRAIAHILGSLDDKIELNRQINATLEGMAQALFKSWFVDFDPVIDNALAAGNPIPEELADRAEVRRAALADGTANREAAKPFPAGFQHTEELGWIPAGWALEAFGKVAVNFRNSVDPKELLAETPYVGLEHIDRKRFSLSRWGCASDVDSQKSQFESSDFLFGKLRPYFHKVCQVNSSGICSTDILVIKPKEESYREFVGCQIFEPEFVEYTNMRSTGTRMPRASWKDMAKYEIALPTVGLLKSFNNLVGPSRQKCKQTVAESIALTKLRDTLLPKLISGELRIPDVEKLAEEALA